MPDPVFFRCAAALSIAEIAALAGIGLPEGARGELAIDGAAPLERAVTGELAYMDNPRYARALETTTATACFVSKRFASLVPGHTIALVTPEPYRAFAKALAVIYPSATRPSSSFDASGVSPGSFVHPQARLETGVTVDPGAIIGPGAEIGRGSLVGANAVIGPEVRIGRDCSVGPNASVHNALIGNRVIMHGGVRIGQDGFGFAMGPNGHLKVPQIGRVIIQDDVEIGANTTIDRGASRDTVIGEGTKIDNLVQIAHNVVIGRHCVIVAQVGISGSSTLEDFVVLAGQAGVAGHVRIGAGAVVAGSSSVSKDIPPGAKWCGTPAKPLRDWIREAAAVKKIASGSTAAATSGDDEDA